MYDKVLRTLSDANLEPLDYPLKGPPSSLGIYMELSFEQSRGHGLENVYEDVHSSHVKDGFQLLIYEPFDVPSKDSVEVQALNHQSATFLVTPKITQIEDSMLQLDLDM